MTIVNAINACTVTREQVDACTRILDENNEAYYLVQSASHEDVEYTVRAIRVNGKFFLTCNCLAGQNGHQCWHRRASVAHSLEYKALKQAETQELPHVNVALEVTDRHVCRNGCILFIVKCGSGIEPVSRHRDGSYSCQCGSEELSLKSDCEHCKVAQSFEEQFQTEFAHYVSHL